MKKIIVKALTVVLNSKGYSSYMGLQLIKDIKKDLLKNRNNTLKEKIWLIGEGFYRLRSETTDSLRQTLSGFYQILIIVNCIP